MTRDGSPSDAPSAPTMRGRTFLLAIVGAIVVVGTLLVLGALSTQPS